MKSLVNHIAQHEYLITLSTYGLQALMEDGYLEGVPREVGTSEISGKSGVQRMFLFQGENWKPFILILKYTTHHSENMYLMIKNFGESFFLEG